MKKLIIYSDIHLSSPHSMKHFYKEMLEVDDISNVYLTGDIVDFRSCPKKKMSRWIKRLHRLEDKFGDHYIRGNHCLKYKLSPTEVITDDILLIHGDVISWPKSKVDEWRNASGGKGHFSRFAYRIYKNYLTGNAWYKPKYKIPKKEVIANAVKLAKEKGCKVLIHGHSHCYYTGLHDGILIINVPRGKTIVRINNERTQAALEL